MRLVVQSIESGASFADVPDFFWIRFARQYPQTDGAVLPYENLRRKAAVFRAVWFPADYEADGGSHIYA
ncbi:MAG: hypothetical protein NC041_10210 [Bacteroides sp.]|nr:hypothetical protein [Prevotella sp.]MCM1408899.1 hypothetical protein [Treponema brennaborense]MCM1470826.1 hypothetical protein [Bacteroides sp.]